MSNTDAIRVETQFNCPQTTVSILVMLEQGFFAVNLRALLELIGCSVHNIMIGTPGDVLKVLSQEVAPKHLVIVGHGTPHGLYCGEFVKEVDTTMLVNGYLPPDVISRHLALPGCNVIGAFCHSASDAMLTVFARSRVRSYVGFNCAPGIELCMFVINYMWRIIRRKMPPGLACADAVQATDPGLAQWIKVHENSEQSVGR